MKYILFAAALTLVLTGCGSNTSSGTIDHPKAMGVDDTYVMMTKANIPELDMMPDAKLIKLGHQACNYMADMNSHEDMLAFMVGFTQDMAVITNEEAGSWIGYTIAAYCPDKAQYLH